MSYDFDDGYAPPPPAPLTVRKRIAGRYWDLVLWLALDAPWGWMNRLGLRLMTRN